jgi:hypothetical protein
MNRKTTISLFFFAIAVLIFTRLDYLTNAELYRFGLKFSDSWWQNYQIIYNCLFQLVIGFSLFYSRNWRLSIIQEAFVLSCGQDLVYFGLWSGGVFPSGNWTWMNMYNMLGTWTTPMQVMFSAALTAAPILMFYGLKRQNVQLRFGSQLTAAFKRSIWPPRLPENLVAPSE